MAGDSGKARSNTLSAGDGCLAAVFVGSRCWSSSSAVARRENGRVDSPARFGVETLAGSHALWTLAIARHMYRKRSRGSLALPRVQRIFSGVRPDEAPTFS